MLLNGGQHLAHCALHEHASDEPEGLPSGVQRPQLVDHEAAETRTETA